MPNNERFRLRYDLQMNGADESADVMIYGEICDDWWKWTEADISATDFDKLLKDAKAKGVKSLTLRINSPGGDVTQAIAMRTMLMNSGMDEIKISIEGMCASAATLIACLPGAHVTMTEGGEYMIHNPRSGAYGEAKDLEAGAKRLRNTEADSASIYARKSGQSEEEIRAWMNAETWMTAKEAHERGFVDAVLDAEPIVASVSNRPWLPCAGCMPIFLRVCRNMPTNQTSVTLNRQLPPGKCLKIKPTTRRKKSPWKSRTSPLTSSALKTPPCTVRSCRPVHSRSANVSMKSTI